MLLLLVSGRVKTKKTSQKKNSAQLFATQKIHNTLTLPTNPRSCPQVSISKSLPQMVLVLVVDTQKVVDIQKVEDRDQTSRGLKGCHGHQMSCFVGDGMVIPPLMTESLFHGPYKLLRTWVDEFIPYYMEIMGV